MESQLSASKREASECLNEHDVVLKANFNIAQELRRVNGELKVGEGYIVLTQAGNSLLLIC